MTRAAPLLLAFFLLLLGAAPASAAEVTADTRQACCHRGMGDETVVAYVAAAGERNAVVVERTPDGVLVRDVVALRAAGECRQVDELIASCPMPTSAVTAELGDGDDRFQSQMGVRASGGDGDDRLEGAAGFDDLSGDGGDDDLVGGDANDLLDGGPGSDALQGGAGDDSLQGGEAVPSEDRLDGGEGRDSVAYSGQRDPVSVDLVASAATTRGVRDALASIEDAIGGSGDDLLAGDPGDNRLEGRDGRDAITGGAGADGLEGGSGRDDIDGGEGGDGMVGGGGRDRLSGGSGDDRFGVETRAPDAYACGDGRDSIVYPSHPDRIAADCELASVAAGGVLLTVPLQASLGPRGRIRVRASCFDTETGAGACKAGFALRGDRRGRPGALLAQTRVRSLPTRRSTTVVLSLRPSVARRLRSRSRRLHLIVRGHEGGSDGSSPLRLQTASRARMTRTASSLSSISR